MFNGSAQLHYFEHQTFGISQRPNKLHYHIILSDKQNACACFYTFIVSE